MLPSLLREAALPARLLDIPAARYTAACYRLAADSLDRLAGGPRCGPDDTPRPPSFGHPGPAPEPDRRPLCVLTVDVVVSGAATRWCAAAHRSRVVGAGPRRPAMPVS